jgi:hypothetical protein
MSADTLKIKNAKIKIQKSNSRFKNFLIFAFCFLNFAFLRGGIDG